MANPHRGEVAFEVGSTVYTLVFSTNAICELENLLDRGLNVIVMSMDRLATVRALLWAGLRARHSGVSLEQAGEIIDLCGMAAATEAIGRALSAAFPAADKDATARP